MERPRTTANIDYDRFSEVWDLSLMVNGGRGWLFHSFHPIIRFLMTKYELSMIYDDQRLVLIIYRSRFWVYLIKSPSLSVSPTRPSISTLFCCVTSGFQFQESQLLDFYLREFHNFYYGLHHSR